MKKLLLLLLFPCIGIAQNDTIFKKDGKVIPCKITYANESAIFYNNGFDNDIDNSKVLYYSLKGIRTPINSRKTAIPLNDKGLAFYTGIIKIDSTSKNDLYISTLEWVNKTYNSAKSVIQTTDKDGGIIIGRAVTNTLTYATGMSNKDGGYFYYTFSIYLKDNKIKYEFFNFSYRKGYMILNEGADVGESFPSNWTGFIGDNKQTRREWLSFQNQVNSEINLIISDLEKYLKNNKKNKDW